MSDEDLDIVDLPVPDNGGFDFSILDYDSADGFVDSKLLAKCTFVCRGRWTPESLYNLFKMGEVSGTLEISLNHLGLTVTDLDDQELSAANRIYLMARAKNLAVVQANLTKNAGSAKEAQVLLESIYEITPKEGNAIAEAGGLTINLLNT